jgi:translation initiation factor 2 beta subunit (eIF-2beta)/eIF-5
VLTNSNRPRFENCTHVKLTSNINTYSLRLFPPFISTTQVEGRGNGIKTVIPNVAEVASALHRDPAEVTKFFGCELGSQTTYNTDTDRAVVNGSHTTPDLQNLLFKYIEKFVLCPSCRLPETSK